jgi:beta-RFAP synthase
MATENSSKTVVVSAPARLHFGLLAIGDRTARKFGGAGLMVDAPRTVVQLSAADQLIVNAPAGSKEAVIEATRRWHRSFAEPHLSDIPWDQLPCEIRIGSVARHRGLGSGTQLAFSVAIALQQYYGQPLPSAEELAVAMGRGKRSAIGSYGFLRGGFLVDRGIGEELIAPLDMRTDFPAEWKIVLIEPLIEDENENGISNAVFGEQELDAFRRLPATTQRQADELAEILKMEVVPGVLERDFSRFAKSVTRFGRSSGMYYSDAQGGPYASFAAERLVKKALAIGEFGIGQSSWGPTLFAIADSQDAANSLVEKLGEQSDDTNCRTRIVSADNSGMTIQETSNPSN